MKLLTLLKSLTLVTLALTLSNCANVPGRPPTPNPTQSKPIKALFVNPFQSGTYEHFKAGPSYPETSRIYKNNDVLSRTNASNSSVLIDLSMQRAFLMNGKEIAVDYPISAGISKFPTPTGSYKVIEKIAANKRSNLYGKVLNAEGKVVKTNADARTAVIPEGGKFQGALMAHWMRLTNGGVGMHRGNTSRRPASHGCIRTPGSIVQTIFGKVRLGTPVTIQR